MSTTDCQTLKFREEFPLEDLLSVFRSSWREQQQETGQPIIRIASFNLVLVSQGAAEAELAAIVDGLQSSHPSRLIWAKLESERAWADSTAALNLVTRCHGQQVHSEQILLRCGNEPARIPSLILPLIHPELPTHLLWWKAGPRYSELYHRLADRSRLVLWEPGSVDIASALKATHHSWNDALQREHAVYPLPWLRIQGARRVLAAAYDKGPFTLELTSPLPLSGRPLRHRLLAAWLAARLRVPGDSQRDWAHLGVEVCWSEGPFGCLLSQGDSKGQKLLLDEVLPALRGALDAPQRDPVFAETLHRLATDIQDT